MKRKNLRRNIRFVSIVLLIGALTPLLMFLGYFLSVVSLALLPAYGGVIYLMTKLRKTPASDSSFHTLLISIEEIPTNVIPIQIIESSILKKAN